MTGTACSRKREHGTALARNAPVGAFDSRSVLSFFQPKGEQFEGACQKAATARGACLLRLSAARCWARRAEMMAIMLPIT